MSRSVSTLVSTIALVAVCSALPVGRRLGGWRSPCATVPPARSAAVADGDLVAAPNRRGRRGRGPVQRRSSSAARRSSTAPAAHRAARSTSSWRGTASSRSRTSASPALPTPRRARPRRAPRSTRRGCTCCPASSTCTSTRARRRSARAGVLQQALARARDHHGARRAVRGLRRYTVQREGAQREERDHRAALRRSTSVPARAGDRDP